MVEALLAVAVGGAFILEMGSRSQTNAYRCIDTLAKHRNGDYDLYCDT